MAVDTRHKRFSMMSMDAGGVHSVATFEADSTVDLDDKQHLLDCYSGIAFANPAAVTSGPYYYLTFLGRALSIWLA